MTEIRVNRAFDRALLVGVVLAVVLILVSLSYSRQRARDVHQAAAWVSRAHQVLRSVEATVGLATEAESSARGYLISGDATRLEAYRATQSRIATELALARRLTVDNPEQGARLERMRLTLENRFENLQRELDRRAGGAPIPDEAVHAERGYALMRALRADGDELTGAEQRLIEERLRRTEEDARGSFLQEVIVGSLGLLTVGLFALALQRHARIRERASSLLAEQSERWRVTLDSIGDAVITTDQEGRVMVLNPEAERLTGWTSFEANGQAIENVFRIVGEDGRQPVENPTLRALREGTVMSLANHTLLLSKSGLEHSIDDSAAPIRDPAGAIVGVVLVFRDVGLARNAGRDLQQLASELALADQRKSELLAMLAHELRNPLAPIHNAVQILRRSGLDAAAKSSVEIIGRQTAHLVRLVDDLLDVSRISSGKIKLRRDSVDLRRVAEQAVESSQTLCTETGQQLMIELSGEPVLVDGDAARLTQAIDNLISNACKYSEPGRIVRLAVRREGGAAVVSVRDQGVGIAPDQLDRIFDMFAQLDGSLERSRGGLGIGLTLVKQFVELHGGRVEARSEGLGKGSEFAIRLPILRDASERRALRILVVDDNADSRSTLTHLLQLLGYDTHAAEDGEAAVSMAEALKVDVVLLDIGLPKLNGYEVARRLRAGPLGSRVVLIAITGWGQEEDRTRSRDAGFDAHLVKPVDHDELLGLLSRQPALRA